LSFIIILIAELLLFLQRKTFSIEWPEMITTALQAMHFLLKSAQKPNLVT